MNTFDNVSDMKAASLPVGQSVRTRGYYIAGDVGAGYYTIKVPADVPIVDGYSDHVIANGNVAVLTLTNTIDVAQFGALGDDPLQDATPIIHAALNKGRTLRLHSKHTIKTPVYIPFNVTLLCEADTVLYGDDTFVGDAGVYIGSRTMTDLGSLNISAEAGDYSISLASAPSVDENDMLCIYDSNDYSFSNARAYYRNGEFCTVADVNSSVVQLRASLYSSYAASSSIRVYKMDTGTFCIGTGKLTVITEGDRYCPPIFMSCISNCSVNNLCAIANDTCTALRLENCYNVNFEGLTGYEKSVTIGTNYGLLVSNSQDCSYRGTFSGSRHGVTTGGGDYVGAIPNRGIKVYGSVGTTGEGGQYAFTLHGNAEYCSMDGVVRGGVAFGGNHCKLRGTVYASPDGVILYHSEITGWDFDYSGCILIGNGVDPAGSSRGSVDLGGNGVAEVNGNCSGGTLNFSGVVLDAPASTRGIKVVSRVQHIGTRSIDVSGVRLTLNASASYAVSATDVLDNDIEMLTEAGIVSNAGNMSYSNIANIINHQESGIVKIPVTTSMGSASAVVEFSQIYNYLTDVPVVATVQFALGAHTICYAKYITSTQVTLYIATVDGSAWTTDGDIYVNWKAG